MQSVKHYHGRPNVGDVASPVIVARVLGRPASGVQLEARGEHILAVGSILEWADAESTVWGTGFIAEGGCVRAPPRRLLAVRGHLSRCRLAKLGISPPALVGDPGALIADIAPPRGARAGVGVVPHYVDAESAWVRVAAEQGACIISPLLPLDSYLALLNSCEVVVSSSLHGVIFAHALGIPAAWVELSDRVLGAGFKFRDYYSSIGFGDADVPKFTEADVFQKVVDGAHLPLRAIDVDALRAVLIRAYSPP